MTLLLRLNTMSFSQVAHSQTKRVLHEFLKCLMIPTIESKKYQTNQQKYAAFFGMVISKRIRK